MCRLQDIRCPELYANGKILHMNAILNGNILLRSCYIPVQPAYVIARTAAVSNDGYIVPNFILTGTVLADAACVI